MSDRQGCPRQAILTKRFQGAKQVLGRLQPTLGQSPLKRRQNLVLEM
ncbi:hypothetical protein [Belnapia moabensis]|nr:hypothetical protein [Belnapia moabensis]